MSYAARLIHTLTLIRTPADIGDLDDYGQPTPGTPVESTVKGLVQPKAAREILDSRSVGTDIGDHTIFLQPMDLLSSDAFTYSGERYEIRGIRSFDFGHTPHLEVDARRIGGQVAEAAS